MAQRYMITPYAQGDWLTDSIRSTFKIPSSSFSEKIATVNAIAEGIRMAEMPVGIPISSAKDMIALTTRVVSEYVNASNKAQKAAPEIADRISSSRKVVQNDYLTIIKNRLEKGLSMVPAGQELVNGNMFKTNISLMLFSVVHGYEALEYFEKIRPGFLDILPSSVVSIVGRIGGIFIDVAKAVGQGLKTGVEAATAGTRMVISLLKWGSVAGGLYLLYKTLK